LQRRDGCREAFDRFDPARIARYRPPMLACLLANPAIIRNRKKIEAAVQNARAFLAVQGGAVGTVNDHVVGCFCHAQRGTS
jgi:DNA-3-methyladenine glycosylase I